MRAFTLLAVVAASSGCNGMVGGLLAATTQDMVLPEVMAKGDIGVGCASGEALGSMITAYGPYSIKAARVGVMTNLSAGMCLDDDIWDTELEGTRALQRGDTAGTKDALARRQRLQAQAATRYLAAWNALVQSYGLPTDDEGCDVLDKPLKHEADQLAYLLGLSSGVLALLNDFGADGAIGVPASIPANVVRAAGCLDDDAWWGVPSAMQSAIYALQDEIAPEDPWAVFERSAAAGDAAGVRLARAFQVQTAGTLSREGQLRDGIRAHAASVAERPSSTRWRMLDVYATAMIRHESDRIWTAQVGHRTPWGELGSFPDDARPDEIELSDDLIDDLGLE